METLNNFILSKELLKYIEGAKSTYLVAAALYENLSYLNGGVYIYFDITREGEIVCRDMRHTNNTSVFRWVSLLLKGSLYAGGLRRKTVWDYYDIKDIDVEKFGNYIKSMAVRHAYTIDIITGHDIKKLFTMPRVNTGRLGQSCMNEYPEYFDMLTLPPTLSAVVIIDDEKRLLGRSFLWEAEIAPGKKITYMDRFYTSKDYLDGVLMEYAVENKYWRKHLYDKWEKPKLWVSPERTIHSITASVEMACEGFRYYPYLDTFHYGNSDFLSNDSYNCKYQYLNTFGERTVCKN